MKPEVKAILGGLCLQWPTIEVEATRLHQHKDGRVTGEILITTSMAGYNPHLHQAQFNFTSTQSRTGLGKHLIERCPELPWPDLLEQVCVYTLRHLREGEPPVEICTTDEIPPLEYLLHPFLPKGQPTMIFGDGGTAKSTLGLITVLCLQLPWADNPLHLLVPPRPLTVAYCDWETDQAEIGWQLKRICTGHDLGMMTLHYRRCIQPLADDLEQVQSWTQRIGASCTIVDSVAHACGGDVNEAEPARRLFQALRSLKTITQEPMTTFLIHHTAKGQQGNKPTPFGSAYFNNYSRSVWESRKSQEPGEDDLSIGLFHRKANYSKLFPAIGVHFSYTDTTIQIEHEDVRTVAELTKSLSIPFRIQDILKQGPTTPQVIAAELETTVETVRTKLTELKRKGKAVNLGGGRWGLQAHPETSVPDSFH